MKKNQNRFSLDVCCKVSVACKEVVFHREKYYDQQVRH